MSETLQSTMNTLVENAPASLKKLRRMHGAGLGAGTGVFYGAGAINHLGAQCAGVTDGRVALIISDPILESLGIVELAEEMLAQAGFSCIRHVDVKPEPVLENAIDAEALGVKEGVDVVVGIGGGSAMDVAKIVSIGLGGAVSSNHYVRQPDTRPNASRCPLVLIPTTAGTGSEVSIFAVISEGIEKRLMADPKLLPDIALLDPLLTVSMPAPVTAATGMDALTHAIEGMVHREATPMNDALSLSAISLIGRSLHRAYLDANDLSARYDMLVGSAFGMMSFNLSGALWAHSVSYILGMEKATPHGLGCALGLPQLVAYNEPVASAKHAQIRAALGAVSKETTSLADDLTQLMVSMNMPTTLKGYGIDSTRLDDMAEATFRLYPRVGNPRDMSLEACKGYWHAMYAGTWAA